MKKYLILAALVLTPIAVEAEISHPYIVDQKPQVLFSDSTLIVATSTYFGLENYTQDYVGGYAHITFTYTHAICCSASFPPLVYVTNIDPRSTTTPLIERNKIPAYNIPPFSGIPTDWYLYNIQFDATGYTVSVKEAGIAEIYNAHNDVSGISDSDWVALANLRALTDPPGSDSMAFSPVTIKENPPGSINPVIIIPGIMGSAYKDGQLVIDPILHTYDDLIATLKANGYIDGQTLFTFPYEWRDSNVISANLLKQKIDAVKQSCAAVSPADTDCTKVDLVAHSMGGLVAREYIQSGQYAHDVDQVIFLGTPHKGAPTDYLQWEAGEFPSDKDSILMQLFFETEAIKNGYSTIYNYVQYRPILSIQELLPTFDYIENKDDPGVLRTYPNNYPRNVFLENLNNNISNLLNSGVKITNIIGNIGAQTTIEVLRVIPSTHTSLWADGEPDGFYIIQGDHGLENGSGDGTVTMSGATLGSSIPNEISASSHRRLPTDEESRIFSILTRKTAFTTFDHHYGLDKMMVIRLLCPVDLTIIAPDGKRMGKNFQTGGEYNEIPNAFYSGYQTEEEYITIPNPIDGQYKIELQGTGNGGEYTVATSYISDATSTTSKFSATTTPGQITDLDLSFDNNNPANIDIVPEDVTPPTIAVTSPTSKDYLRSEKINITADSEDASGISSFLLSISNIPFRSGEQYDPFFSNLGTSTLYATSTDNLGNIATTSVSFRIIANIDSTVSDINRAYNLGWIFDKKTRDDLIRKVQALQNGKTIDKKGARALMSTLNSYLGGKINQQAYNLITEDLNWIINH